MNAFCISYTAVEIKNEWWIYLLSANHDGVIFSHIVMLETNSTEFTLYEIQTQTNWSICWQLESDWLKQVFPNYRFLLIILLETLVTGCTEII